jgi:hypothetical protein
MVIIVNNNYIFFYIMQSGTGYVDLLGNFTLPNASTDILIVTQDLELDFTTPNTLIGVNSLRKVISYVLSGTVNQISVSNPGTGNITLSLPQNINTSADVIFNSGKFGSLLSKTFIGTDTDGKLVERKLLGTLNQLDIKSVGNDTTLSLPQNIDTNATPTFSGLVTNSIESIGTSLNIGSNNTTQSINVGSGTGLQTVNIGSSGSGVTTVNIGAAGDIVNIAGSLNYIQSDNLEVKDATIVINKGSAGSGTARSAGIHIRDNNIDNQGYITVGGSGNNFTLKAPENGFILSTPVLTGNTTIVSTGEAQTISGVKTFSGNVNMSNLTANWLLSLDGSKNIISSFATSDIARISQNQTFSGVNTFSGNVNMSNLTANWILSLDGSKNIISSFATSDIARISQNQTFSGVNTFSGNVNLSSLTDSTYIGLDGSKNIISMPNPSVSLLSSNNTWTGTNTFSSTLGRITIIGTSNQASVYLRGNNGSGYLVYSQSDTNGLQFWDEKNSRNILNLRNAVTASRLMITDADGYVTSGSFAESDIVRTTTNQTISGVKTFSGNINLSGLTANWLLSLDGSKNIVGNFATSDIARLSQNQTFTGVNTFSGNVNLSSLTANSFLSTDASRNVIVAPVAPVLVSGNQSIAGNKTFSGSSVFNGDFTLSRSIGFSTLSIVSGNNTLDRAVLYLQSFGGSGSSLSLFCDATTCNLFNNNTGRTVWEIPNDLSVECTLYSNDCPSKYSQGNGSNRQIAPI